jgi:hypothetical protein
MHSGVSQLLQLEPGTLVSELHQLRPTLAQTASPKLYKSRDRNIPRKTQSIDVGENNERKS